MAWNNRYIKRKVPHFDISTVVQPSTTLDIVQHEQEHNSKFDQMLAETKANNKRVKKEIRRITNRPIVKQRLVHLYVSGYYTKKQIGNILCLSTSAINHMLQQPDVIDMIKMYQDEEKDIVDTALKSLRIRAVETQAELLESDNDNVRADISKDILNRTGHGAVAKTDVNVNISYEERLAKLAEGAVIKDVEYTESPNVINDKSEEIHIEGEDKSD